MKSSILLALTIFLSTSSVFAQDSEKVVSIGRNNVEPASIFNSVLHLTKKDEVDSGKYYEIACVKDRLILNVVGGEGAQMRAEMKAKNCAAAIRDIYEVAFSETMSAELVISDVADAKGIYGLSLSYK